MCRETSMKKGINFLILLTLKIQDSKWFVFYITLANIFSIFIVNMQYLIIRKKMLMLREKAKKRVANTSLAIVTDQKYFKDIKYLTHQTLHWLLSLMSSLEFVSNFSSTRVHCSRANQSICTLNLLVGFLSLFLLV